MKWTFVVLGSLLALGVLVALVGAMLPKSHSATRSVRFQQPPDAIWEAITNIEAFPAWREGLKRVERLPDVNGRPAWRETDDQGQTIPFTIIDWEPPRRLVGRISDPKLPFGGTWTYVIAPTENGSTLTITEDGEIYNPVFRFVARFILGYAGTMETYLRSLGRKFGEQAVVISNQGD